MRGPAERRAVRPQIATTGSSKVWVGGPRTSPPAVVVCEVVTSDTSGAFPVFPPFPLHQLRTGRDDRPAHRDRSAHRCIGYTAVGVTLLGRGSRKGRSRAKGWKASALGLPSARPWIPSREGLAVQHAQALDRAEESSLSFRNCMGERNRSSMEREANSPSAVQRAPGRGSDAKGDRVSARPRAWLPALVRDVGRALGTCFNFSDRPGLPSLRVRSADGPAGERVEVTGDVPRGTPLDRFGAGVPRGT